VGPLIAFLPLTQVNTLSLTIKYNIMKKAETILTVVYLALIAISLTSLIWAILSGEISMETLKTW
jgi:hypothetical protein